jgi:TPP-dependent pyruvate/acetoin dehydrogenase alpha subunit
MVLGTHRSHGHYLAKGGSLEALVAEVYCRESGCARGRGGSMHLIAPEQGMLGAAPIVAGTVSLAVGAALAARVLGEARVAVAFFGDGATGEGVVYESMNLAALHRLPVIFVCENNLYSTHLPIRECRPDQELVRVAEPFGIACRQVDGNDVQAVLEAASEAVSACRAGEGPWFLECLTYRLRGHVGPDDNIQGAHTDIRPEPEVEAWRERDPVTRLQQLLIDQALADEAMLEAIRVEVEAEVARAHEMARASRFPDPEELTQHVFR